MTRTVVVRVLKLVDVDPFRDGLPYIQITSPLGVVGTSEQASAEKDESKYRFDLEADQNGITFNFDGKPLQLSVAVLSKDALGHITQYPGVGKITIFEEDWPTNSNECTCPLHEDGDEMLEIGALLYSFELKIIEESTKAADGGGGLHAEDWNAESLQLSPREEDFNIDSLKITPRVVGDAQPAVQEPTEKASLPVPDVDIADMIFDRSAKLDEAEMAKFLVDAEPSDGLYEIDSVGLNEELIVAPVLHINAEHMHLAPESEQRKYSTAVEPPQWQLAARSPDPPLVADTIRADLDRVGPRCTKIAVRLHSVICSSSRPLDTAGASAKLSVLPLPGRVITLRSVAGKGDNAVQTEPTAHGEAYTASTTLSFGLKTAQLGMSAGDLRSRTFREGACPRLAVEVALGGAETYTAFAELYLPALLAEHSGQVISVPLVSPNRTDGDHSSAAITASLLLEVNPSDLVPDVVPLEDSAVQLGKGASKRGGTKRPRGAKDPAISKASLQLAAPAKADLELSIQGLSGPGLAEYSNLGSTAVLEAYLTGSGCTETASLQRCASLALSPTDLSIKKVFSICSLRPKLDLLQLRVRNGPFPEDEIGRVCIPLAVLFQPGSADSVLNRPIGLTAWRTDSDRGGAFTACKWRVVATLSCKAVEPSRAVKAAGAPGRFDLSPSPAADAIPDGYDTAQLTVCPTSALSTVSSPFGGGNWLSSPDRTGTGFTLTATDGGQAALTKPTAVRSVSGQLLGSVKGYFAARSALDGTGNQEPGEEQYYLGRGCTLNTEVTLLSEGLRKRTGTATAAPLRGGDISALVEWAQGFSMFVAFAAQQRSVPVLQLALVAEKTSLNGLGGATKGGGQPVRSIVATAVLDLSTLLTSAEQSLISILVPVRRVSGSLGATGTSLAASRDDIAGWLLVGLRFLPAAQAAELKSALGLLEGSLQSQWSALAAYPTQYCLGVAANAEGSNGIAVKALQSNPDKISTSSIHVALGALQFASQRSVNDTFGASVDGTVTCLICAGGDSACVVAIRGSVQGDGAVIWSKADGVMQVQRETSLSLLLCVHLFVGSYDPSVTDPADAIAEAVLPVARDQLAKGLPVNFLLPLRDRRGERAASLIFSVQLTSLAGSGSPATTLLGGTSASALLNNGALVDASPSPAQSSLPLRVEICEGNIAESEVDDRMEPFFECSLLLPEQEELKAGPGYPTKARTGFLRLSVKLEAWGLDCLVHVPPSSVAGITLANSTMLSASRTRPAFDAAQLSNGACILGIVCRDASKQGCPEIGWARIALPRQLILQSKTVEQWVTLSPPNPMVKGNSVQAQPAAGKHSRMRIRVSVDHNNYDAACAPFGVGAVLLRALGVHDFRAGMDDDLVAAKLSAYSWRGGTPGDAGERREEHLFSQLSAHPATYINEMSIFNEDSLVAAVPVPGGFGDVRLSVKTFTTNTAYTTSFPIMASTTKAVEGADMPGIPVLSLNLSREKSAAPDPNRTQRVRLEPQLKVAAAFVPYVTGRLVLHCTGLELVVAPDLAVPRAAVLRSADSPLALRYLLGNNSSKFMFSRPFTLCTASQSSTAAASRSLGDAPTLSDAPNITFMEVDTFEVISTSIRRGEHMAMLPLFVSLLEQWDLLDPVVERRGQQACVGVGCVPTAALYYQALRAAASAPMDVKAGADSAIGSMSASPWLSAVVDLFDPTTKLKVAVAHLNIQFVMSAVPEHVQRMLGSTVSRSLADPSAKARVELGLKQSFLLADADRSGAVSSEELLQVITRAGTAGNRAAATGRTNASAQGSRARLLTTVGMEDSVGLLLQLANLPEDALERVDPQAVGDVVRRVFAQLDVDGDGLVSWWEWKTVLSASILGHNPASTHMYHLDALVVGMQAAFDAIKSLSLGRALQAVGDQYAGYGSVEANAVLPYIRLKLAGYDASSQEAIVVQEDDSVSISSAAAPSKTVSRLHSMVKSLRLTNSVLAKRFERALSAAQSLAIDLDQDALLDTRTDADPAGATRQGAKLSEIEALEQRVHDTEHQSEENLKSFLTAKERADRLLSQLSELKTHSAVTQAARSKPELFSFNEELAREIQANEEKVRQAQQMRKQRTSEMMGLFRLKALVSKLIMPKVRQRRRDKAAAELARFLSSQAIRRNYLTEKEKRRKAALVLQGAGRGLLGRKRVKEMHAVAAKTQALFRARLAKRTLQGLRAEKAELERRQRVRQEELRRNIAACKIARAMRVFTERIKEERNSAALRLQSILRNRLHFKAAKKVLSEKRAERDLRTEEERRLAAELAALREAERLREEEENRRQEAALKLTRAMSTKSNIMLGKKIHAFLAAQNSLTNVARPPLEQVAGLWVSYPKTMTTLPSDAEEAHSSFHHFGRGNYGHIQAADPHTRIMDVMFLYNRIEGASKSTKKSGAQFELVKLPYDHPVLEFYTTEAPAAPQMGYLVSYVTGAEHQWLPPDAFGGRPERIEDAVGYKVGVRDPEADPTGAEGAINPGRVVAFDKLRDTVCVLFDASDPTGPPDHEDMPWQLADIQWLMPPAASRPKTIEEAIGYNVEVNRAAGTELTHRAARGTVINVKAVDNTVRVVYAPPPGQTYASEAEYIPFDSSRICWLNKVPLSHLPSSPRTGSALSKRIEVSRPVDIMNTVGHLVEVRAVGEDAEPDDMYPGMVVAADSAAGTVRVLYDGADRTKGLPAEEDEEDFEDLPWISSDILWVVEDPAQALRPPSAVRRPRALEDAVGRHVDVVCREDDAQEGDYYSGVVVAVDNDKQTMRVVFDGNDNNENDYEDLPWHSADVYWLSNESVQGRRGSKRERPGLVAETDVQEDAVVPETGDEARSVGNSTIASHLTVRPRSLAEATEWKVKVGAELLKGQVQEAEASSGCLWVVFDAVPDAPGPVQVKIPWKSPNLEWLPAASTSEESAAVAAQAPLAGATPPGSTSAAPRRPASLSAAVGWAVEVRAEDAEDEVFVGQVVAADAGSGLVKVLFAGEDGSLQEDDADYFPLDSPLLTWTSGPDGATAAALSEELTQAESAPAQQPAAGPLAAGPPQSPAAAVGRSVNVVLDFVPGTVTSTSQALQTVNLQLQLEAETAAEDSTTTATLLLLGVPFASSMIEWDCKL